MARAPYARSKAKKRGRPTINNKTWQTRLLANVAREQMISAGSRFRSFDIVICSKLIRQSKQNGDGLYSGMSANSLRTRLSEARRAVKPKSAAVAETIANWGKPMASIIAAGHALLDAKDLLSSEEFAAMIADIGIEHAELFVRIANNPAELKDKAFWAKLP